MKPSLEFAIPTETESHKFYVLSVRSPPRDKDHCPVPLLSITDVLNQGVSF